TFQTVLSRRQDAAGAVDPFLLYRYLRALNPAPYLFYLALDDHTLVGSSPEVLVRVEGGEVTVRPIAGTRPRGRTPEEDEALGRALLADEKERAEHLMLVDLGRNDVGRVAQFGSVRVTDLLAIERYSHVQHLVSEVRGRLREGYDALDVFKACFPAGTVTGAPKVRAMQIIDELEPERRGPYAGAVGYVGWGAEPGHRHRDPRRPRPQGPRHRAGGRGHRRRLRSGSRVRRNGSQGAGRVEGPGARAGRGLTYIFPLCSSC